VHNLRSLIGFGLTVSVIYVVAAHLGFRVAVVAEQVTTVWAPTGIAQAALLLWGLRLWPFVWLGAFLANVSTNLPLAAAGGIATGNTLEAVAAAWALTRFTGFDPALRRVRDAIAFIVIASTTATILSASIGTAVLCASGAQPWNRYGDIWADWWLGDLLGSLIVAPVLLTTLRARPGLRRQQILETAVWVASSMIAAALVFGPLFAATTVRLPLAFVVFPFVIAAAVRLGQPATALVLVGTAGVAITSTILGSGPFASSPFHERLVLAQVFMGVLAGSGMLLAAALTERRIAERRRAAVYGVGDTLARSVTLDAAIPAMLRVIGETLNWQVGAVWLLDGDAALLRCQAVWARDPSEAPEFIALTRRTTFPSGLGLPGRVWQTGQPAWIEDVVDDRNFPRAPIARKEGLHGAFAFPISFGDQFLGVVEFFNTTVSAPDQDLLATMALVGHEIGQFINRKQVEGAVADNQSRTRAILETALDAIISMDHHGRISEFNSAAERMFGRRRDDVIGCDLAEVVIPERLRAAHRGAVLARMTGGTSGFVDRRFETVGLRATGEEFPVEVSITRVPTDPPMFTGFVRDVTARVAAERDREQLLERELVARREAETANRAKDDFLATLSHELRTPLNAIVGWTRMLLDGTLDQTTARRALEIIDRNAQTQVQLVGDILDVSRIITGKLSLDVRPVDLGTIVGTVLDGVRPAAAAKRIRVRSKLSAAARVTRGDPHRLQQIVWNLVSNAIKFTPDGGAIDVELSERPGSICIIVSDSGAGIAPEFLGRIFDRFSQADSSSTRAHGGLGLGLAIVRHLVELHGGTVRASSEGLGRGASFTVELPTLTQDFADAAQSGSESEDRRAAAGEVSLNGCRVLVVEDETDASDLIATVLTRAGAAVDVVASVGSALAAVRGSRPDVLLSDIGIPGDDGYVLIREVRKQESQGGDHLPAAAVTAYARSEDRRRALDAGFDGFIPKPVQPGVVVRTVRDLWQSRR
jgi:PAS domain S-box-containing protein